MEKPLSTKQQYWLDNVKSAMASDLTFNDFAKQQCLDLKSLYNWKSKFVHQGLLPGKTKSFVKVKPSPAQSKPLSSGQSMTARLPNGIELDIRVVTVETLTLLKSL